MELPPKLQKYLKEKREQLLKGQSPTCSARVLLQKAGRRTRRNGEEILNFLAHEGLRTVPGFLEVTDLDTRLKFQLTSPMPPKRTYYVLSDLAFDTWEFDNYEEAVEFKASQERSGKKMMGRILFVER